LGELDVKAKPASKPKNSKLSPKKGSGKSRSRSKGNSEKTKVKPEKKSEPAAPIFGSPKAEPAAEADPKAYKVNYDPVTKLPVKTKHEPKEFQDERKKLEEAYGKENPDWYAKYQEKKTKYKEKHRKKK
jgi:hypothetical protein